MRYFEHVFEELGVRDGSCANDLDGSSAEWCVVVIFVQTSFKTTSVLFHF